jgi:hypothetical protein
MIVHTRSQIRPLTKTMYPPYISASRPKGKRKAPVTSEKTLAGHVSACDGISSAPINAGRRILNPEIKYSATNMEPRREKQKPISTHMDLKTSGRSRPRRSISDGLYAPDRCGGASSTSSGFAMIARDGINHRNLVRWSR